MSQCFDCVNRLKLKPLPDETFLFCPKQGETVADINIRTGVSPAIDKHGFTGILCDKFTAGKSIGEPPDDRPFDIPEERLVAEKFLLEILLNNKKAGAPAIV